MKLPIPTKIESQFDISEFFFSTTDSRGVIKFGNDVFIRVSGYPKEKIFNAPHNIIRHPDMPKAVFKLFWEMLKSNKPVAAYVKNLSADGSYYWVFAFAFPVSDGYLSIRFKPSSSIFNKVIHIYSEVSKLETSKDMTESSALLLKLIKDEGFENYEKFMVAAALEELNSREKILAEKAKESSIESVKGQLGQISQVSDFTSKELNSAFNKIKGFSESNQLLLSNISKLGAGFSQLSFLSINMQVASARLGSRAITLAVVSSEFSSLSGEVEKELKSFFMMVNKLSVTIQASTLALVALKTQMLMVDFFVKESIRKVGTSQNAFQDMKENQTDFCNLFGQSIKNLSHELHDLRSSLHSLSLDIQGVQKLTSGLEVIKQVGALESAREDEVKETFTYFLKEMAGFVLLLKESISQVEQEKLNLMDLSQQVALSSSKVSQNVTIVFKMAIDSEDQAA